MDITINQLCGIEEELKSHPDFKNFAMLTNLRENLPEEKIEANQNWQYYLQFVEKLPEGQGGAHRQAPCCEQGQRDGICHQIPPGLSARGGEQEGSQLNWMMTPPQTKPMW
jgi:hypothetical protein